MKRSIADHLVIILQEARSQLLSEIEPLSDQQLNLKLSEDQWSVSQIIQHLSYTDKALLPGLRKAIQEDSEKVTEKNFSFVLNRTNKVKSPLPEPSSAFIMKDKLLTILIDTRTPIIQFINEVKDETILVDKSIMHPLFGVISVKQMLEFISLHERRHIEQIKEIKANTNM